MSAMEKMLADIVLKAIPPELREQLTVDNFHKLVGGLSQALKDYHTKLDMLVIGQEEILEYVRSHSNNGAERKQLVGPSSD